MSEGKKSVPELRFPEFAGQPWKIVRLGDVTAEVTNRNSDRSRSLEVMGVTKSEGIVPMEERVIAADRSRYKVVSSGWFAYNPMRLNIGSISRWQGEHDILVSPDYVVFRCLETHEHGITPAFLDHFRKSDHWQDFVTESGLGSVRVRIYYKDIARLELSIPSLAEQAKIADCLGSLDELIAAQARKVDALKTHKTGLMRQLFPREGETQSHLRFSEFRDAAEWGPMTIRQLGEIVTGNTPSTAKPEYYGGGRLFVSPADISDARFVDRTKTTLTELGFLETRKIRSNSVLFVCIGSTIGKVAQNRQECATNQQINAVITNAEHSAGFVYYALSGLSDRIAKIAGKQAVPIVNKSLFSSIELVVPKLPEQERIARLLSSIDETLLSEGQRLESLKTHKKGLMQQLFPSAEPLNA